MNKWQDMFDILREDDELKTKDGGSMKITKYYIIHRLSGEKVFNRSRQYGYSEKQSAMCGAAALFKYTMKSIERDLLGG